MNQVIFENKTAHRLSYRKTTVKLFCVYCLVCVFDSPGKDLKAAVWIDPKRHLESFQALERYFKTRYQVTIDKSVKDVSRLCFYSYDPDAYFNPNAKPFLVAGAQTKPKRKQPGANSARHMETAYQWDGRIEGLPIKAQTKSLILNGASKPNRSEAMMTVLNGLVWSGLSDDEIISIFEQYPIGEKYREKGRIRQNWLLGYGSNINIARARKRVTARATKKALSPKKKSSESKIPASGLDTKIAELNRKHAVIMLGGKCCVLNETIDPVFHRPDITFSSPSDFHHKYANKTVPNPAKPKENISISKLWWKDERRREYEGIIFDPKEDHAGYYNLWRGFAVKPKPGDWSLFKGLVNDIGGKSSISEWILAWMARIVQDPGGQRPGTAIVLRGRQGTGKGTFASVFGAIFGNHYLHLTNPQQVVGRFNSHLKDCLLAFVDEGFWAGDKQAEGIIKAIITEELVNIEPKGKDVFTVKNNVNLIIASNNEWVIPAGLEERRFFVLDMPITHQQNHAYFKAIKKQMANGGREAMLYDLLRMDISGVNLREFERTEGLLDQILHSMSSVQKFWFERLMAGSLLRKDNGIDRLKSEIDTLKNIAGGKDVSPTIPNMKTEKPGRHPEHFNGWQVRKKGKYFEMVRRIGGKLETVYVGAVWNPDKAAKGIEKKMEMLGKVTQ